MLKSLLFASLAVISAAVLPVAAPRAAVRVPAAEYTHGITVNVRSGHSSAPGSQYRILRGTVVLRGWTAADNDPAIYLSSNTTYRIEVRQRQSNGTYRTGTVTLLVGPNRPQSAVRNVTGQLGESITVRIDGA